MRTFFLALTILTGPLVAEASTCRSEYLVQEYKTCVHPMHGPSKKECRRVYEKCNIRAFKQTYEKVASIETGAEFPNGYKTAVYCGGTLSTEKMIEQAKAIFQHDNPKLADKIIKVDVQKYGRAQIKTAFTTVIGTVGTRMIPSQTHYLLICPATFTFTIKDYDDDGACGKTVPQNCEQPAYEEKASHYCGLHPTVLALPGTSTVDRTRGEWFCAVANEQPERSKTEQRNKMVRLDRHLQLAKKIRNNNTREKMWILLEILLERLRLARQLDVNSTMINAIESEIVLNSRNALRHQVQVAMELGRDFFLSQVRDLKPEVFNQAVKDFGEGIFLTHSKAYLMLFPEGYEVPIEQLRAFEDRSSLSGSPTEIFRRSEALVRSAYLGDRELGNKILQLLDLQLRLRQNLIPADQWESLLKKVKMEEEHESRIKRDIRTLQGQNKNWQLRLADFLAARTRLETRRRQELRQWTEKYVQKVIKQKPEIKELTLLQGYLDLQMLDGKSFQQSLLISLRELGEVPAAERIAAVRRLTAQARLQVEDISSLRAEGQKIQEAQETAQQSIITFLLEDTRSASADELLAEVLSQMVAQNSGSASSSQDLMMELDDFLARTHAEFVNTLKSSLTVSP